MSPSHDFAGHAATLLLPAMSQAGKLLSFLKTRKETQSSAVERLGASAAYIAEPEAPPPPPAPAPIPEKKSAAEATSPASFGGRAFPRFVDTAIPISPDDEPKVTQPSAVDATRAPTPEKEPPASNDRSSGSEDEEGLPEVVVTLAASSGPRDTISEVLDRGSDGGESYEEPPPPVPNDGSADAPHGRGSAAGSNADGDDATGAAAVPLQEAIVAAPVPAEDLDRADPDEGAGVGSGVRSGTASGLAFNQGTTVTAAEVEALAAASSGGPALPTPQRRPQHPAPALPVQVTTPLGAETAAAAEQQERQKQQHYHQQQRSPAVPAPRRPAPEAPRSLGPAAWASPASAPAWSRRSPQRLRLRPPPGGGGGAGEPPRSSQAVLRALLARGQRQAGKGAGRGGGRGGEDNDDDDDNDDAEASFRALVDDEDDEVVAIALPCLVVAGPASLLGPRGPWLLRTTLALTTGGGGGARLVLCQEPPPPRPPPPTKPGAVAKAASSAARATWGLAAYAFVAHAVERATGLPLPRGEVSDGAVAAALLRAPATAVVEELAASSVR